MNYSKVVVLGGSFNPPTIAHYKLLRVAVDDVDANLGVFIPSSHNYVQRKMNKSKQHNSLMSESFRVQMLEAMCDSDLVVDKCELQDDGKGHTYRTLCTIQKEYTNSEVYFCLGYDNLKMVPRWHHPQELLNQFKFVVFDRDNQDSYEYIKQHQILKHYVNRFHILKQPKGIDNISSSKVRELLDIKDSSVEKFLHPKVYKLLQEKGYGDAK